MAALFVLAHVGHWATNLAFFGPVIVLPLGLYVMVLLERRREVDDEPGHPASLRDAQPTSTLRRPDAPVE